MSEEIRVPLVEPGSRPELADAMTHDIEVPDALIDRVRTRFDARGLVEVVATVAAYNMVSRFLVAINLVHRP